MRDPLWKSASKTLATLGLALLASCAVALPAQKPADLNLELVRKFTSAWLVDKDYDLAKSFLSPSFFVLESDQLEGGKKGTETESAIELLKVATACSIRCSTGESCFFTLDEGKTSVWAREHINVGKTEVAADARLSNLLGQDLEVFSSRLSGCGLVVSLGVSDSTNSAQAPRITFLSLFAP